MTGTRTSRGEGAGTISSILVPACVFMIAAMSGTGGCAATDPEMAEYNRVDGRLEAIAQYEALKEACRAAGSAVHMDRSAIAFQPTESELRSAQCRAFR